MSISQNQLTRIVLVALAVTLAIGVAKFCFRIEQKVEAYYGGALRSTRREKVLFGQQPTSNRQNPPPSSKAKLSVPNVRMPEPSFPILVTQPSPVNLTSYEVKYVGADDEIHTDCIREIMAKEIPTGRILPSSLRDGAFKTMCDAEKSLPYKPWPF